MPLSLALAHRHMHRHGYRHGHMHRHMLQACSRIATVGLKKIKKQNGSLSCKFEFRCERHRNCRRLKPPDTVYATG